MKKRLRRKIAKEILGVTKLNVSKDECLIIEVEDVDDVQLDEISKCLKAVLNCKVIISTKKLNITVVDDSKYFKTVKKEIEESLHKKCRYCGQEIGIDGLEYSNQRVCNNCLQKFLEENEVFKEYTCQWTK